MSIDKIKKLIEENYSPINEMAKVGDDFKGYSIIINSDDHEPKHVHFFKDGNLMAKIEIAEYYPELLSDLNVLWKSPRLRNYMLTDLIEWFSKKYKKRSRTFNMTNLEACLNAWDLLHD